MYSPLECRGIDSGRKFWEIVIGTVEGERSG